MQRLVAYFLRLVNNFNVAAQCGAPKHHPEFLADRGGLLQHKGRWGTGRKADAILPDLMRGLRQDPFPSVWKGRKMIPRFIVAGPIDGLYHVLYKVPGTIVHSSVGASPCKKLALEECAILNDEQQKHDQEKK